MGATHSPLGEPDVKVSLIRLFSGKFPTAGRRRRLRPRLNQQPQAQTQELLGVGQALGRAVGTLASSSQVSIETAPYEVVDLPVSPTRAPE